MKSDLKNCLIIFSNSTNNIRKSSIKYIDNDFNVYIHSTTGLILSNFGYQDIIDIYNKNKIIILKKYVTYNEVEESINNLISSLKIFQ